VTSYRDGGRLERAFQRENDHRALFIAYIMAGDPDLETSFQLLKGLAEHADVIELGMPFSDPMAEGPTIQLASQRSLAAGTKMRDVLAMVRGSARPTPSRRSC
jgi:tryptophan synthase alpha chain